MIRTFFSTRRRTDRGGRRAALGASTFATVVCLALLAPSGAGAFVSWSSVVGVGRANLDGAAASPTFIADARGERHVAVDALIAAAVSIQASPASIIYGEDMQFTATVSGGAGTPTGSVQFQVDGANEGGPVALDAQGAVHLDPPSFIDVGSTITALYAGDGVYGSSRGDVQPHVQQARTATSLTSAANPPPHAGDVTYTATVENLDTGVIPFGSVEFFVNGQPITNFQPLDDNGQVAIVDSNHRPADFVVSAAYHDDTAAVADFVDSRASLAQHVAVPAAPSPPAPAGPALPEPAPAPPTPTPSSAPAGPARVRVLAGQHPTLKLSGGGFAVDTDEQARCPTGAFACTVTVVGRTATTRKASDRMPSAKTLVVGRATVTIRPGRHAELVLALDKQGVRLLRARKRLVIRTTTTTRVGTGPSRSLVKSLTVKLSRAAPR
jgi:hypothetical protein